VATLQAYVFAVLNLIYLHDACTSLTKGIQDMDLASERPLARALP